MAGAQRGRSRRHPHADRLLPVVDGTGATRPNRLVGLVLLGAVFLGLGAASLGIALLTS